MKYRMGFLVQARSPEAAIRKCSDRFDRVGGSTIEPHREDFLATGNESNWEAKPAKARPAAGKAKRAKKTNKNGKSCVQVSKGADGRFKGASLTAAQRRYVEANLPRRSHGSLALELGCSRSLISKIARLAAGKAKQAKRKEQKK
jgi:hypothetical protein